MLSWFPEYENYGLLSKVELGITSTMKYLVIDGRIIFIVLTGIMTYYILTRYKSVLYKIVGIVPFLGAIAFNALNNVSTRFFPSIVNLMDIYSRSELIINKANMMNLSIYIPIIIYGGILFGILLDLVLIFKNTNALKFAILIFGLGFVTRFIIGFSPTVFASGERTSLFLYYSFISLIIMIYKKCIYN